jgi:hypothetical protein
MRRGLSIVFRPTYLLQNNLNYFHSEARETGRSTVIAYVPIRRARLKAMQIADIIQLGTAGAPPYRFTREVAQEFIDAIGAALSSSWVRIPLCDLRGATKAIKQCAIHQLMNSLGTPIQTKTFDGYLYARRRPHVVPAKSEKVYLVQRL